jgi:hypothetical protein
MLQALPDDSAEKRAELRTTLMEMVEGIILLEIPVPLAWTIYLNTRDFRHTSDYGPVIAKLQDLIPRQFDAQIGKLWRKFMAYAQDSPGETEEVIALCEGILVGAESFSLVIFLP